MSLDDLKQSYLDQKRKLEETFLTHQDCHLYLRDHSSSVDSLVKSILETYSGKSELAVFAIGGYGREELFPSSDLDILFVFEGGNATAETIISSVLHVLWDTGLDIGHQVWNLQELEALDLDRYQFALALLDIRPIGTASDLGDYVTSSLLPKFLAANSENLTSKIIELTASRHREFDETIYQLEPDLKLAPGGLRDLQVGRWLTRLSGTRRFIKFSTEEIENSETFLKRLRILIHLMARRNDNRLTHIMQDRVRKYVGYRGASPRSGVESLMKEYFQSARICHGFCLAMIRFAEPKEDLEGLRESRSKPKFKNMAELLKRFLESIEEGRPFTDFTRQAVTAALPGLSSALHFPSLRETVKALFRPRPGLYKALSEMYELGVLELLFPEFGSIRARVIWDFYHRYTVDEHTLLAIRNVESLADGTSEEDGRFKALLKDAVDPSMLTLALLFHDVGKGRGGQHSDQSARMAARALKRFRFEAPEIETIVFLIQHHLAMSSVILKRDLEDEQVILRFSDLVKDPELLRLLTLLTYADIKAVAPGTLNEWKRDLLWQLYIGVYRKLTLGFGEDRVEDVGELLLASLQDQGKREELEQFVEGFPSRYLRNTPPSEVYEHFRMAQRLDPEHPIQTRLLQDKEYYELWVVTPDRSSLFAKIVGLLSYFEMNILRGHGFANRGQTILDFFQFLDSGGHFRHLHEKTRFQQLLNQAIAGEISVEKLLRGKEKSVLFRRAAPSFEPSLYFEDEHSDRLTILEIVAPDAIGLLYRISREISSLGCDIELALISTEGEKAVDVFYLCHEGSKLSTRLKKDLSNRIFQAIT